MLSVATYVHPITVAHNIMSHPLDSRAMAEITH